MSTASLIVGVAAAAAATSEVLVAVVAGLMSASMAAGEYVSVSSQSDAEQADFARERAELASQPEFESAELAQIYIDRGVSPDLAQQIADQLMAQDEPGAHARDGLGISQVTAARPIQAALTSAATFAVGAAMPLAMVLVMPQGFFVIGVTIASLLVLAALGAVGARACGANVLNATLHVTFCGALSAGIGALFGTFV